MKYFTKAGLGLAGLLAATALSFPAIAQTKLTMYYPIAVGGPLTGVVDGIIPEPLGGAHHDPVGASDLLKQAIVEQLDELCDIPGAQLRKARYDRFRKLGVFGT